MTPLIDVRDLCFRYSGLGDSRNPWTLRNISFSVAEGSTIGIVGESGSGKSTLIRLLCGLIPLQKGEVRIAGRSFDDWMEGSKDFRRLCQIVFQNPRRSFDPRLTMGLSLSQPIRALERRIPPIEELARGLERVGLPRTMLDRYPHQLSGGQLQRVAIARALTVRPRILSCRRGDERPGRICASTGPESPHGSQR